MVSAPSAQDSHTLIARLKVRTGTIFRHPVQKVTCPVDECANDGRLASARDAGYDHNIAGCCASLRETEWPRKKRGEHSASHVIHVYLNPVHVRRPTFHSCVGGQDGKGTGLIVLLKSFEHYIEFETVRPHRAPWRHGRVRVITRWPCRWHSFIRSVLITV